VGQAADGAEALERIAVELPDVVIMDIEMPRLDGLEATRQLRARSIPVHIVVLTVAFERRAEALAAGADAFIHKGAPMEQLIGVLEAFRPSAQNLIPHGNKQGWNFPINVFEWEIDLGPLSFEC
jgi:CheY-like chemotaxis protein